MLRKESFLGVRCISSSSCVSLMDFVYGFTIVISPAQHK